MQALDYLLKPIDDEHLARAIQRARERLAERVPIVVDRVLLRDRGRVVALEPTSIDWVQSDGDYVRVYVGRQTYLHHTTLAGLAGSSVRSAVWGHSCYVSLHGRLSAV